MRWSAWLLLLVGLLVPVGLLGPVPDARAAGPTDLTVASERADLSTSVGRHFDYRVTIANGGSVPTGRLLAHLNVASVTGSAYVDPEDWSSDRSRFLPALAAGASTELSWDVQAVSAGTFAVYVVLLPAGAGSADGARLVVSTPTRVRVAERRTLDAGGTLPVAVAVPVLVAAVAVAGRLRDRARSRA